MSKLKLLGALLLTIGGTTQLLYAEQPSIMANSDIVQQKSTCSGVVKDASGESVIGASVLVKGTTIGTITDFDGNFELPNVEKGAVIQVSFVGYLTKEVVWKGTPISVVLEDDTKTLEEVVVVGYGTQKKVNLTGSVAMAESDVLENRPIANLAQGLQGVIPNLNISFANGNPNAETSINVRGLTSLNGGSALVLVDGVETNDISLINPQDIESISVLKDASSAAVYGARAAFGVVLITTKKGKTGEKITFNYNNNFSWSTPSRLPHSLPADQWLRAMNTESKNTSGTQYWSDELIAAVDAYMQDPTRPTAWENTQGNKFTANGEWAYAGNTDWMDIFYKNAAFMQQHNASLRGGSEKTAYYASLGYKGQDGLLAFGTDTYKRINMSFNFTSKVTNWLEIGFRTKYNRSEINEPNSNHYTSEDPYYEVYRAFPFIPVYLPDGDFAAVAGSNFNFNIAGMLAQAGRKKNIYDDIWYTGSFNLTPLKGLSIKGDYTGNRLFRDERAHNKTIYQKQPDGSQIAKGEPNGVSLKKYDDTYQALNLWAEYKFELPKSHSFTAMVGYNQESKKTSNFYGYVTDLYLNDAPIIDWANTKQKLEEEATIWAVQGAFFRLNYDYAGKYLVEVNGRYDGSSKYGEDDRWGFFPSASAAWRISEENFFAPLKSVVDDLKIRASIGQTGTESGVSLFGYLSGYNWNQGSAVLDGEYVTGLNQRGLPVTNLSWTKNTTKNIGFDLTMFGNRLTISADAFRKDITGVPAARYDVLLPSEVGYSLPNENLNKQAYVGTEAMATWTDHIGDFNYRVSGNITFSRYRNIESYKPRFSNSWDEYRNSSEDRWGGIYWGYQVIGQFQSEEEIKNYPVNLDGQGNTTLLPGDLIYKDVNNDGVINGMDERPIGFPEGWAPILSFGGNIGLEWKGIDLNIDFSGGAMQGWRQNYELTNAYHNGGNSPAYLLEDRWHRLDLYDPESEWVPGRYPAIRNGEFAYNNKNSDFWLHNVHYLRISNLEIGYSLPTWMLKPIHAQKVRIYGSVSNLCSFDNVHQYGIDPEITAAAAVVYPQQRTFLVGFNVTF